jgi:hypothetical protein
MYPYNSPKRDVTSNWAGMPLKERYLRLRTVKVKVELELEVS